MNVTRIFDFAYHQLENYPQEKCFNYKEKNSWKSISSQQFITDANKVSSSLLALGIKPNDKIVTNKIDIPVICIEKSTKP